jgi:hypothetical protein
VSISVKLLMFIYFHCTITNEQIINHLFCCKNNLAYYEARLVLTIVHGFSPHSFSHSYLGGWRYCIIYPQEWESNAFDYVNILSYLMNAQMNEWINEWIHGIFEAIKSVLLNCKLPCRWIFKCNLLSCFLLCIILLWCLYITNWFW